MKVPGGRPTAIDRDTRWAFGCLAIAIASSLVLTAIGAVLRLAGAIARPWIWITLPCWGLGVLWAAAVAGMTIYKWLIRKYQAELDARGASGASEVKP